MIYFTSDLDLGHKSLINHKERPFKYGHKYNDTGMNYRIYDVGVDANDYKPFSLDDIMERLGIK